MNFDDTHKAILGTETAGERADSNVRFTFCLPPHCSLAYAPPLTQNFPLIHLKPTLYRFSNQPTLRLLGTMHGGTTNYKKDVAPLNDLITNPPIRLGPPSRTFNNLANHKLKFGVYHEARQSSQLFSPDRFRCIW